MAIRTFEQHGRDAWWAGLAAALGERMRAGELDYPFSEEEYYVLEDKLREEHGQFDPSRRLTIGGRQAWSEVTSGPSKVWAVSQVAREFGGRARMCDLGCGLGLVVHFCQRLGMDAMGVEYQRSLEPAHRALGIRVLYGDLFRMDMGFLADRDVIYMYQPVKTAESSIALLGLVHSAMRPDAVVLYNGMWDGILARVRRGGKFAAHPIHRDRGNDSSLVLLARM